MPCDQGRSGDGHMESASSQNQDDKNDDDDEHNCSDTEKHGMTPFLARSLAGGNCLIRGPRPGLAVLVTAQRLADQAASHMRAGKGGRYGSGGSPPDDSGACGVAGVPCATPASAARGRGRGRSRRRRAVTARHAQRCRRGSRQGRISGRSRSTIDIPHATSALATVQVATEVRSSRSRKSRAQEHTERGCPD